MNTKMIAAGASVAANSVMLISQLGTGALPTHLSGAVVSSKANESVVVAASEDSLTLEESFLRVPQSCKDRTFSFDPTPVGREVVSENILSLHSAMGEVNA